MARIDAKNEQGKTQTRGNREDSQFEQIEAAVLPIYRIDEKFAKTIDRKMSFQLMMVFGFFRLLKQQSCNFLLSKIF